MIIVYSSKSGSSMMYAHDLSGRTGLSCYSISEPYPKDENIVFFGWLRKDTVVGIDSVDRSRLKAVGVVGLDSEGRFDKGIVADRNNLSVPIYYLRGWIDRSKLNVLDKCVLLAVSVMMKLQGLNEFNKPIFDAMMDGGSFYDPKYLDSIEQFIRP